jgi:hypothetical protein
MALFFDLQTLETKTRNDSRKLVETLRLHYLKKIAPKNVRDLVKPLSNLVGTSFLLNAKALFEDKTTDIVYKAQYIRLAGRRDYLLYKLYGYKHLDLSYFLDINVNTIKHNPLLTITENKIYFKYEELNKNGT